MLLVSKGTQDNGQVHKLNCPNNLGDGILTKVF